MYAFVSIFFPCISAFCFFLSFILSLSLTLFLLKGSLSKSNTVSLSVRQLQSSAPWSDPSILSPTSWLFKRAKAQQCGFLNTQIQPSANRGTVVWQKILSLSLSHFLSLPWTLTLSPLSLPTLLHRPHYTRILFSSLPLPSKCTAPSLYNLSFVLSLTLTPSVSYLTLSIPLPSFTFFISGYLICPHSSPGTPSQCPMPPLYL